MPTPTYSADEVDQLLLDQAATMYSQDQVDALVDGLQAEIDGIKNPPNPPQGKIIGSADMSAFRGLKISGHRTYNGFGAQRQYNPTVALAQVKADLAAGRKPYFSIGNGNNKAHPGGPQDWPTTLTGLPIDTFVPTVATVQKAGGTLIIHHEPEDDPGNPANFKTWFGLMADYYRKQVPGIRIGLCLMSWTGRQGGPGFPKWTPDTGKFDVFCIDGYAHAAMDTAPNIFANALSYTKSLKKPLMITETGQENTQDQAAYLHSLDQFVQANAEVEGFLYWNGGGNVHNYVLTPSALPVYGQLVSSGHYAQATAAV